MKTVIGFATTNPHKLRETEACIQALNPDITVIAIPPSQEVEESGITFSANAMIKLGAALQETIPPEVTHIIAEDAGLIIEALAGRFGLTLFPGVYSDRWFSDSVQEKLLGRVTHPATYIEKNQGMLKLMEGVVNRRAHYEACVTCWSKAGGKIIEVTGTVPLAVADSPRGDNGFGYDPIMIPAEYDPQRTMAELSTAEKNTISHRYHALSKLLNRLGLMPQPVE